MSRIVFTSYFEVILCDPKRGHKPPVSQTLFVTSTIVIMLVTRKARFVGAGLHDFFDRSDCLSCLRTVNGKQAKHKCTEHTRQVDCLIWRHFTRRLGSNAFVECFSLRVDKILLGSTSHVIGGCSPFHGVVVVFANLSQVSSGQQCGVRHGSRIGSRHKLLFPQIIACSWQMGVFVNVARQKICHRHHHRLIKFL